MDMVRIGIAQYGFWPSRETWMHHYLKKPGEPDPPPAACNELEKYRLSVKDVPAGDFNRVWNQLSGQYTHTYSHGSGGVYPWFSPGRSAIWAESSVGGHRTAVVGLINMNMMMIDITEVPSVKRGDEVVIVGLQQDQEISVSSFSELSQNLEL